MLYALSLSLETLPEACCAGLRLTRLWGQVQACFVHLPGWGYLCCLCPQDPTFSIQLPAPEPQVAHLPSLICYFSNSFLLDQADKRSVAFVLGSNSGSVTLPLGNFELGPIPSEPQFSHL